MKYLIINADDFGMSEVYNEVILKMIEENLITSTTILINRVRESQKNQINQLLKLSKIKGISIGLHLEFTNENYKEQIEEQYLKFIEIMKQKPSHLDLHKSTQLKEAHKLVVDFCNEKELPMRRLNSQEVAKKTTDDFVFFGSVKEFNDIEKWIITLKENKKYEILFHPGKYDSNCKSSFNKEREEDVRHIYKLNNILRRYNVEKINFYRI